MSFAPPVRYLSSNYPQGVALGDLDGDGRPDLVIANGFHSSVTVRLDQGAGLFGPGTDYLVYAYPWNVVIADLDADHRPEVIVAGSFLRNQGNGKFGGLTGQNVSSTADLEFVAAGDFNSDGAMALVIADGNYTKARVFMNRGGGDFGIDTAYDATGYPLSVATGDLNGDGWLDCVVCEYSNGRIGVRLNDGRGGIEVLLNTSE